ncbi:Deoxycytidine monophosphate (dCMP) deaminase [Tilletia horrida]|nr:Deoxycytidine monophosphate (dCMP) deaminase [Tilletia horrida]
MFIALVGPPCAGKDAVARFLQHELHFRRTRLAGAPHHAASALTLSSDSTSTSESSDDLVFDSADALLEHATVHWREPLLTLDLATEHDVRAFLKRPFFLLVGVQAPLGLRWQRYQSKYAHLPSRAKTLEQFITLDDRIVYGNASSLSALETDPSTLSPMSDQLKKIAITATGPAGEPHAAEPPLTPPASNTSAAGLDRSLSASSSSLLSDASHPEPLSSLFPKAALVLTNAHTDLADLHSSLHALQLPATLPTFLRPAWDHYFLSLCSLASLRSNCMKRRVGAVLVRANRVLSTGYNGTPRGMKNCNEGGCGRCNGGAPGGARLDECLCLHAEENALLECGRERGGAEGTVLYCNTCPCLRCAVKIVQTGVREVVYELDYSMDDRSRQIFEEAGIKFRKCSLPTAQR